MKLFDSDNPVLLVLIGLSYLLVAGRYSFRFATGSPVALWEWGLVVVFTCSGGGFLLRAKYEVFGVRLQNY